ncbi:hypothetical protein [Leptospira ilyithenensis]|uniref:Uncharacterized protein n=1 Tax=Leptospira ilyithenensis TaxID=2484901 RepID=A0A4R9LM40_9LEPT|nr:hypothetical protein [Leptospira ilyithenensis]TGN07058.1 hypothetical protein EHS11_18220 [Leptospira ilyithenensis]
MSQNQTIRYFLIIAIPLYISCAKVITQEQAGFLSLLLSTGQSSLASSSTEIPVTVDRQTGIQISASGLTVTYAALTTLAVKLSAKPTHDVTVSLSFDTTKLSVNGSGVSPVNLTFTENNFDTLQNFSLDAVNNANDTSSISLTTQSTDTPYDSLSKSLSVNIQIATAAIISSVNTVSLDGGGTGSFGVRLNVLPTNNVNLTLSFSGAKLAVDGVTSSHPGLSFTPANYSTLQTVNLRSLLNTTESVNIGFIAFSSDADYNSKSKTVSASVTSNTRSIVLSPSPVSPSMKPAEVHSFTVAPSVAPTSDITVSFTYTQSQVNIRKFGDVSYDTDGSFSITLLSGSTTAQTIQVKAVSNINVASGTISIATTVPASPNGDISFDALTTSTGYSIDTDNVPVALNGNIQNGNQATTSNSTTYTLGTTVDPATSFVICNFQTAGSDIVNATTCQLNSSGTQVEVKKGASGTNVTTNYYVMNFSSGISVQRGATVLTSGTATIGLSQTVNTNKAFIISYVRTTSTGAANDNRKQVQVSFADANNLNFSCNGCTATTVEWQVVQWHSATVQSGTATIADTASSTTATLSSAVDLSKTFLIFNHSYTPNGGTGQEQNYFTSGAFSSTSQLSFQRGFTQGTIAIQYFAVSVPSGLVVKSNDFTLSTSETNICDVTPSGGVTDYLKSMMITSNRTGTVAEDTALDSSSLTYEFRNSGCGAAGNTNLKITRYNNGDGTNHSLSGTYFLLEFN